MDVKAYMYDLGRAARAASYALAKADTNTKNRALHAMADALVRDTAVLVAANEADLAAAACAGCAGHRNVAELGSRAVGASVESVDPHRIANARADVDAERHLRHQGNERCQKEQEEQ